MITTEAFSTRLEQLKSIAYQQQVERCCQMLTDAGVPEWVMNSDNQGVPANSLPHRLRWYLSRRKDVSPSEIDQELQREMDEMYRCIQASRKTESP